MKTLCLDALLIWKEAASPLFKEGRIFIEGEKCPASFRYHEKTVTRAGEILAQITLKRPLALKWNDEFEFSAKDSGVIAGRGRVLIPHSDRVKRMATEKRAAFLRRFAGTAAEMLSALCREKGVEGLSETEIKEFCRLDSDELESLSRKLEAEGAIKILVFAPLFLLAAESFDFLLEKIKDFLAHFHEKHPGDRGILVERVQKQFGVAPRIMALAVRTLERAGKVREFEDRLALSSHRPSLTPQEEKNLARLEEMSFKGEFHAVSEEEIRREFHLTPRAAEKMLSLLIERKKVVQTDEGMVLHARWLDEIVKKIKALGKNELTVSEFKEMTGLSRKYAIPLLELLDRMGVTRRKGPVREIL